jgi:membrane associated rhomboid family serine protease
MRDKMDQNMPIVPRPRSVYIWIWFALDAFLALFPPVYWVAAQPKPKIFGFPCSIVYFGALGIFITASLLAAYWDDERRDAFKVPVSVNGAVEIRK